jgi:hypothetical protein
MVHPGASMGLFKVGESVPPTAPRLELELRGELGEPRPLSSELSINEPNSRDHQSPEKQCLDSNAQAQLHTSVSQPIFRPPQSAHRPLAEMKTSLYTRVLWTVWPEREDNSPFIGAPCACQRIKVVGY